jgi:transcriptional regulator with XRE-family HTH domain
VTRKRPSRTSVSSGTGTPKTTLGRPAPPFPGDRPRDDAGGRPGGKRAPAATDFAANEDEPTRTDLERPQHDTDRDAQAPTLEHEQARTLEREKARTLEREQAPTLERGWQPEDELRLDAPPLESGPIDVAALADLADERSSARRLSPTLMRIFQRRRQAIGLSLDQTSKLSGIAEADLSWLQQDGVEHRLTYDHAIVLARVLGVPASEMPGLRPRDRRLDLATALGELERVVLSGPLLRFEGRGGERFGGDVERVASAPSFAVRIDDSSLGDAWPKGTVIGFQRDAQPEPAGGSLALLRHRRSALIALRRVAEEGYVGLAPWQPAYPRTAAGLVEGGEWLVIGVGVVVLPCCPS